MLFQYIIIYIDTTYLSDMETMSSKRLNLKVFLTSNIQCYFDFKTWHCFNIIIWTLVNWTFWRWTNVKKIGYRLVLTLTFFNEFILNIDPMLCFWCWTSVGNHVIYLFISYDHLGNHPSRIVYQKDKYTDKEWICIICMHYKYISSSWGQKSTCSSYEDSPTNRWIVPNIHSTTTNYANFVLTNTKIIGGAA